MEEDREKSEQGIFAWGAELQSAEADKLKDTLTCTFYDYGHV
jgi:hypothetical protein